MGFWDRFRRIERTFWHVCYECVRQNGNQTEEAIFYYDGPPEEILNRPWVRCPRCQGLNTRSFQFLKQMGEEAALLGMERIVRSNPRSRFPVKPHPEPTSTR